MDDLRDSKLHELRRRITNGDYRVEPGAVADAIVGRKWALSVWPESPHTPSLASGRQSGVHVSSVRGRAARTPAEALAA
jgi:hypothetical protein